MGEWLQGKMHGAGFMLYPDGEHYIGILFVFHYMCIGPCAHFSQPSIDRSARPALTM